MSNVCQAQNEADEKNIVSGWDEVIAYTRKQLERAERRVANLRAAVKSYEWNKERGFPWPGDSATRN
jgi:hypothetical protein